MSHNSNEDGHNLNGSGNDASKQLIKRQDGILQTHKEQPETHHGEDDIDLKALWSVVLKRKWTIITFFLIVVMTAVIVSLMMTPIYSSVVVLQIDRQESRVVDYEDVKPIDSPADGKEFYATQYELLKSRSLATRIITILDLWSEPTFVLVKKPGFLDGLISSDMEVNKPSDKLDRREKVIDAFLQGLKISPVRNSRLVKVAFESPNPILAEKIANAIATEYISINLERRMDASSYAKTFLTEQLTQTRARLEESEKELVAYARSLGVVEDDNPDAVSADNQVLVEYTKALAQAEQERIKAESIYKQMQGAGAASFGVVLDSKVIQDLKSKGAALDAEYQDALQIYKPDFPLMLQKKSRIDEIQKKIDDEVRSIKISVQMRYEAAKAEESALRVKRDEAKEEILSVQDRGTRYSVLKREVDTNRQLYEGLLQRMKEVSVAGGVGLNNISVVDRAKVASSPIKPKKSLIVLIAAVLGLMGGVLLVFLIEMLDDSIKGVAEFEKISGLPVLGIIPDIKRKRAVDDPSYIHAENLNSRSAISEAFRSLRTALQFTTPEGAPKVVLFTSARPGEGKTTTSLSVAIQFAQAGRKVLIVDLDLRKPSLHKILGVANDWGVTNYLAGDAKPAEITRSSSVGNLFIVPSGPLPPNPAELISSGKMFSFLSLAVEKFDIVIIDGPPVLGLADAPLLGNLADATVLIVEADITRVEHMRDALKRLRSAHSKVIGGVLTKVKTRHGSYGYEAYYQYGK